jgi:hypothetical protein
VEDPNAQLDKRSLSGVVYRDVLTALDRIYPPTDLSKRNAVSRADGYWPYIKEGSEPPLALTYGEFDFPFFADILDKANQYVEGSWDGKVFCDIGSGTGRLVISAAALHPGFRLCRGVEYLKSCHDYAQSIVDQECTERGLMVSDSLRLLLAPIELTNGSIGDPETYIGDIDIAFITSSAMPSEVLDMISKAIGAQCKPGTVVVSTDYEIPRQGIVEAKPYRLELLESMDGYCWIVGGTSTAYFYRLVEACSY